MHISNLAYRYPGTNTTQLSAAAFMLAAGTHAILLGPSGCGKSTLLHLIAAILTPHQGSLRVAGTDLKTLSPRAADAGRADALLKALGLADKSGAKPHQLSQGQQQRVAIARAMFNRPQLLLADEPTANLDDAACSAGGASLVVATHDARVLAALPGATVMRLAHERAAA